ncbi:hypothetical protein BK133_20715 [Paenibacillus sp. FSL H8-0548]|uniref:hypothetical protein n=1 Tax=Paenibacillus sp. FSL H8-0548 TaxID=1920422 RepID=UPI00096BF9EE|nr:hypothetical protein [Paenibacillus sp. FSL H8-0548]OMF26273.1 hypothetical protein BK133_20715 [Paenibacillus sp. FSL H8-0548]
MENVNLENIIKSFFLGIFMGIILQFYDNADGLFSYKVLTVLASGSIGFFIGFITEWLTSILPISMANARMYFFINNLIALLVTTFIMAALLMMTSSEMKKEQQFMPILLIVLGIICIANLVDYMMYRRAQAKLKTFKEIIKDK